MPEFQTFDLGRSYAQAEAVKGGQQDRELRGLQIAELKKPKKMTFDELMSNQQIAHAAFTGVAQNPESAPYWTDVLKKAGIMPAEFDVSKIPPQQLQEVATRAAQQSGKVLAALDPKQYGEKEKDLPDWAKDAAVEGVDVTNPGAMSAYHQKWMTAKESGANQRAQLAADTSRGNAQLSADTARRGQDISDENADATRAVAAQIAAAGPKPTEANYAAASYAGRMQESEKLLTGYSPNTKDFILASKVMSGGATTSAIANANMSPEGKKYYYAAADWVRAKLRKESGASIPPDEMSQEIRTYFPMPNDDAAIIAQKAQARAQALAGVAQSAGSIKPNIAPPVAAPADGGGAPDGIDPAVWGAMNPEERALWQN